MGTTVLQVFSTELLAGAGRNPILAPFAIIIGLLIWFNLVSQVYLVSAHGRRSARRTEGGSGSQNHGVGARQVQPGKTPVERQHPAEHPRPVGVSVRRRGTGRPTPR